MVASLREALCCSSRAVQVRLEPLKRCSSCSRLHLASGAVRAVRARATVSREPPLSLGRARRESSARTAARQHGCALLAEAKQLIAKHQLLSLHVSHAKPGAEWDGRFRRARAAPTHRTHRERIVYRDSSTRPQPGARQQRGMAAVTGSSGDGLADGGRASPACCMARSTGGSPRASACLSRRRVRGTRRPAVWRRRASVARVRRAKGSRHPRLRLTHQARAKSGAQAPSGPTASGARSRGPSRALSERQDTLLPSHPPASRFVP